MLDAQGAGRHKDTQDKRRKEASNTQYTPHVHVVVREAMADCRHYTTPDVSVFTYTSHSYVWVFGNDSTHVRHRLTVSKNDVNIAHLNRFFCTAKSD